MSEVAVVGEKIGTIIANNIVLGPGVLSRIRESCIYVVFTPGTTAGVIAVEGAHDPNFTGTWANITTVTWATTNTVHRAAITGTHLAIRLRPTTPVAGGTGAEVHLAAN